MDRGNKNPRILIEFHKHGTYYNHATGEELPKIALEILKDRMSGEYEYLNPDNRKELKETYTEQTTELISLDVAIESISPDSIAYEFLENEKKKLREMTRLEFNEHQKFFSNASRALESKDGWLALHVLYFRSDHEYQRVELEYLNLAGRDE